MNNEKLMKSTKVIDRLLKIVQGFMVAGIIVSAVFVPLTLIFGEQVIAKSDELNLDLGDLTLTLSKSIYQMDSIMKGSIIVTLILAMAMCAFGWYGLKVLRSILLPIKEGRPFDQGISDKIRKLAMVALIGGALSEVGTIIAKIYEFRLYDLSQVFNHDIVTRYTYNYVINFNFAILAGVLFILSYVFRYGEALQKESDETL